MKKTLLTILATAYAFSASAESSKESKFYVTGALGGFLQNKVSTIPTKDYTDDASGNTYQYKYSVTQPNIAVETVIGAGYYALDNFRIEALYVKPFLNKSSFSVVDTENNSNSKDVLNTQLYVNSLQVRGYVDLVDISNVGKLYAGGGIGVSHVRGKTTLRNTASPDKFKSRFNFAYALGVGAGFDVSDNINLGVEYNFSHHGKAKLKQNNDLNYKTNVRGHSLLAKLRFDI